ncbi:MAG: hypothetical protein AAGJ29_12565 [Pseudomonadota bacterium]
MKSIGEFTSLAANSPNGADEQKWRKFVNAINEASDEARYRSLFLENWTKGPTSGPSSGEFPPYRAGFLEAICELHTEYLTLQFRIFPFAKSFQETLDQTEKGKKIRSDVQRALAFMEGTARSPTESPDQSPPNNNDYLSRCNEAIDAIYEDVWSYLGLGANDLEEHFQKYCAALTRRYDEVTQSEVKGLGIRDEALARAALTYLEIEQHGSKLKLRESSGDDRYAGHLEIAAVFDGCVVRRSKDTITTERNRHLRDRQLNDLEEYNSRIYPHDLSDFYSD